MKVPVFEEIEIKSRDEKSLKLKMKKVKAGTVPLYIDCMEMAEFELEEFAEKLNNVLSEMNIHPLFPYPIYLINDKVLNNSHFLILPTEEELPLFYRKKTARLKNKEQSLLNKVDLNSERIRNKNIEADLKFIKDRSHLQKELFNLNKKETFLLKVQEQLAKSIREEM